MQLAEEKTKHNLKMENLQHEKKLQVEREEFSEKMKNLEIQNQIVVNHQKEVNRGIKNLSQKVEKKIKKIMRK